MTYIKNCHQHLDDITGAFEPARSVDNFLTQDEIEHLILLQFQLADKVKYTQTSNNIQPVCNVNKLFEEIPSLTERFYELIGDFSDHHTGNYYITTQLHDAHVDLLTERECLEPWTQSLIPYKSCVIPLMISDNAHAQTAFFNQRHIGYSITFDRVGISEQANSDYELSREYPNLFNIDGTRNYSNRDYERKKNILFPQIPVGNLKGLSIETVLDYTPGSVMLFDACQIHASCVKRSKPNYKWLKSGINIQFYKEV